MIQAHIYDWGAEEGDSGNIREVVGVFQTEEDIQKTIDDCERAGFNHASFSRPIAPQEIERLMRCPIHSIREVEDNQELPRESFIDPGTFMFVRAIIILLPLYVLIMAAIAYGAATGWEEATGIFGFTLFFTIAIALSVSLVWKMTKKHQTRIKKEKELGGLILWARTGSVQQDHNAVNIFKNHGAVDVHLHGSYMKLVE